MSAAKDTFASIFHIQRMSIHDGPGIRTNVFFKGCNLRCFWCHNPESWQIRPEIQFFKAKCIGCGSCLSVCPLGLHDKSPEGQHIFQRESCTACGKCAAVCPSGSLVLTGQMMTIDEITAVVKRDIPFYKQAGGGVTLSGGEPLLQYSFVQKLLRRLHNEHINTAIESALCVPPENLETVKEDTDFFLVDIKVVDEKKHREFTGISNTQILSNLRWLDSHNGNFCLRIPLISGVNDDDDTMRQIARLTKELKNTKYVEFMPYHKLGESKYTTLGLEGKSGLAPPAKERMAELATYFSVEVRF
jgi:pyruvate formate lyase activating enzyme